MNELKNQLNSKNTQKSEILLMKTFKGCIEGNILINT